MTSINKDAIKSAVTVGKQRSYNEIVEFLDAHWHIKKVDKNLNTIKQLDKALGSISQKLKAIFVGGTNGKSLTIHFAEKILADEGLQVGAFCSPHMLTYNERFSINGETISNKTFTEVGNDVINTAETLGITPHTQDILTMMAFLYFNTHKTDVVLLEINEGGNTNPVTICSPKIAAVTRVVPNMLNDDVQAHALITEMLSVVRPGTHVISADQSKLYLQTMLEIVKEKGGIWDMPIRKLAPLEYPFEQLHGRCAALAERIAYVYVNQFSNKEGDVVVANSLLTKQKGQRGRPTLEAKRLSELNPKKTVEQFWKNVQHGMPGRFQLLDKEKPSLLLDNASNLDAFKNLLLGIRLLHYARPLKGLTLLIGCNNEELNATEFLKLLRYFFKKTSGNVIICPVEAVPGQGHTTSWDIEKIINETKTLKIKAKACKNFKDAFEAAQKTVDDRNGLVVITGSSAIVSEYWRYKGVKKF
jgi:folylpolyglutamate synthase/dihydrofolate synthase